MSKAAGKPLTWQTLLWTAAIVLAASLPHWLTSAAWIPVLLCTCVAWRLTAPRRGWPLPNKPIRMLLAFGAFAAVLAQYQTINGVQAGSALLIVMIALKFLEARTQRDQLVLMMISYFLVFASLLDQQAFWVVIYLLGFVWLATVGFLKLGRPSRVLPSAANAKVAARMLLQALPIMLVLFLLFPRLPGPLWAMGGARSTSGYTGLSDTMSPGDITNLGLSEQVAFRVEFLGAAPPPEQLYWRGPVLSTLNGRTWSRDSGIRGSAGSTIEHRGEPIEYRVMLEPSERGWIFALDMPREWSGLDGMFMGSDYQLRTRLNRAFRSRLDYRVTSHTSYAARPSLTDLEQRFYTRLPRSNPRTHELAQEWRARSGSPREIVEHALRFFRTEPFYYTLTPAPLGNHSADMFLFETREGFCEHYASAFAILMRAAGIPARVVTGYQGGELNSLGEYYIVRQADAHAWTEVWLRDAGWVRVDPTAAVAPERITLGSVRGALSGDTVPGTAITRLDWIRKARLIWDAADMYWYDWVIGYGPVMQRLMLRSFGIDASNRTLLVLLAAGGTAAVLAALSVYLGWAARRGRRTDAAARCFEAFCRRVARRLAVPRRPHETPTAFGARAAAALPELAPRIREITVMYLKARYERDPEGVSLERLRRLVRQLEISR